jgi:hypothetical protein
MTPLTILQFLVGSRSAIETIAACKQASWLGLLFVFSAALAREYDGQDLLHEPWHLLLPLVASLATSILLYLLLRIVEMINGNDVERFFSGYWSFLGLYWMTAPLAWLYAIPVEHFLSEADATRANLWLLGIVSLWRVLLITRAASVLWNVWYMAAFFPVMLFANSVLLLLVWLMPKPVIEVMGGIRLSQADQVVLDATLIVAVLGLFAWWVWLIGTGIAACVGRRSWHLSAKGSSLTVSLGAWAVALFPFLVLFPPAIMSQSSQWLRHKVESDLRAGRYESALRRMSAHERSDFPPVWNPPPRIGYGENVPPLLAVIEQLTKTETKPWVRELFMKKLKTRLSTKDPYFTIWETLYEDDMTRYVAVLEQLPERDELLADNYQGLKQILETEDRGSEDLRARIRSLLGEKAKEVKPRRPTFEEETQACL